MISSAEQNLFVAIYGYHTVLNGRGIYVTLDDAVLAKGRGICHSGVGAFRRGLETDPQTMVLESERVRVGVRVVGLWLDGPLTVRSIVWSFSSLGLGC